MGSLVVKTGKRSKMEHSRTALPTCYRILYYYGDFPVALSFAEKESGERDRAKSGSRQQSRREKSKENKDSAFAVINEEECSLKRLRVTIELHVFLASCNQL